MQKQYEEQESTGVPSPADSEQNGYKNDFSVYIIDSIIYKDVGTSTITDCVEFITNLVTTFNDLILSGGLLEGNICNRHYIFTSKNDSIRQGIKQNYWTSFVRIIKRTCGDCRDCQESKGGV